MNVYFITQKFVGYTKTFHTIVGAFTSKKDALKHLKITSAKYLNKSVQHTIKYDGDLKCFYYTDNKEITAPYSITTKPLNHMFTNSNLTL